MKDTYLSLLRHLLSLAGGVAISRGLVTQSQAVELGGALVALAGMLWGSLDEWIAARKIEDEARIAKEVEAQVAKAIGAKFGAPAISEPKTQP